MQLQKAPESQRIRELVLLTCPKIYECTVAAETEETGGKAVLQLTWNFLFFVANLVLIRSAGPNSYCVLIIAQQRAK